MIKQVRIKNFQSLHNVTLELGRFVVIVGESDIGKSAIIRAIDALASNRAGQDFITHGSKATGVALRLSDGTSIAWRKDSSATYRLQAPGAQVQEYTKTGREVPWDIASVLRIGELQVGGESLNPNLHRQFDTPFLIAASPATRARILGEISGINILYLAIAEARRREQANKRLQTTRLQDLEQDKTRLITYRHLPLVQTGLTLASDSLLVAQGLAHQIGQLQQSLDNIQKSQLHVKAASEAAEKYRRTSPLTRRILQLGDEYKSLQQATGRNQSLQLACQSAIRLRERIKLDLTSSEQAIAGIKFCPTCQQPWEPIKLLEHTHA